MTSERPSYLTREGHVSLARFPSDLHTVEALECYICHIARDLDRLERDRRARLAVRRVSIREIVMERSKESRLGVFRAQAMSKLERIQDRN